MFHPGNSISKSEEVRTNMWLLQVTGCGWRVAVGEGGEEMSLGKSLDALTQKTVGDPEGQLSWVISLKFPKFSKPGFNSTGTVNFQMFKLDLERQRNQRSNCQHPLDYWKSKRVPEKHLLLLYWICQSVWLCGPQQTLENSSRDRNTRPPDLPLEKSVCRSGSNS